MPKHGAMLVRGPISHNNPLLHVLTARRVALGITRQGLSDVIGLTPSNSLALWELGRANPKLDNFVAWANALGMDVMLEERK